MSGQAVGGRRRTGIISWFGGTTPGCTDRGGVACFARHNGSGCICTGSITRRTPAPIGTFPQAGRFSAHRLWRHNRPLRPDPRRVGKCALPHVQRACTLLYSKKVLDENKGDLKKVMAPGTGAFQFKEHRPAERWIMERNPNYWDAELPYLDQIELIHVPAWTDRGTGVLSGQLDMSWNISRETWDEGAKRKAQFGANRLGNYGCYAVMFNTKRGPLADPRVRRAIHLAVSRQDLITAFETQEMINLTRWIPYGNPLATPSDEISRLPGYRANKKDDIAEAKKLMAEAGYANGIKGLDFCVASVAAHAEILGPAFQDQLKQTLNIDCNIRITERALQIEDEQKGNFDIVLDTPGHTMGDLAVIGNAVFRTGETAWIDS
ncbi:MAG: hypothetical protein EBT47_08635 [Chloroflexi bacterium]|nr:hypothetical protein [Chloroflexota bacterium]